MTRATFTESERESYRENARREAAEIMEREARKLMSSQGWQDWARVRAAFRNYSAANVFMIMGQRPDATRVTSFKKWKTLGRNVCKGERAIRIWAPLLRKPTAEEVAAGRNPNREILVGYRLVPVFDVAQTHGEPLPAPHPDAEITGDSHAHLVPKLEILAGKLEYTVSTETLPEGVGGYCDPRSKRIVLADGHEPNAQVRVLVHELAHALGVGYQEYGRDTAEVIVETATYIVLLGAGLDTGATSIPYVAGWGEASDLAAIKAHAAKVDEIAREIERAIA